MLDAIFSVNTIWWGLMVLYVPACIGLIAIVLLQQGKGGGFGGALGGGGGPGADTVFGTKSAQTLPVKMTYAGAALFMIIAIVLSVLSGRLEKGAAPDLLELSEGDPAVQGSVNNNTMSTLGLGTGVVNALAHDGSAIAAPEPETTPEAAQDAPDDAADEGSSDAAE